MAKDKTREGASGNITLSLGKRLMVFNGLRTRRTLRDLMVLMSRPLFVLQREAPGGQRTAGEMKVAFA